jgi:hypothetical protein
MSSRKRRTTLGVLVAAVIGLMVVALPGAASARDRNHDKIPDKWEKRHSLSLHKNQAKRDQDRDALKNRQEWKAGDDPRDSDSDNDGVEDGDEGAGTIATFQDHVLTINLFNGGSISGLVTDATEVKCDNGDDQGDEDRDGEGGHHGDTGDGEHHGDDGDSGGSGDDIGEGGDHAVAKASGDGPSGDVGDDDPGDDDQGDDNDEQDDEHACSAADLVKDAVVQEADLELEHGDAVFEEIELAT